MTAAIEQFPCATWCSEDDHHVGYAFRADQSCWGPELKTIFSLDEHAPAIGATNVPSDAAGMAVYAYQGWYQLPKVKINVFWEGGLNDKRDAVDHDFQLTPAEAIELANNLIAAVETLAGIREGGK